MIDTCAHVLAATRQIVDTTATKGPINVSASATGPMASMGTFTGNATARTSYWDLGGTASGTSTGDTSPFTYFQAASYASFAGDITYTSPLLQTALPARRILIS